MTKKTTRYNKPYMYSAALAALLFFGQQELAAAAEEPVEDDLAADAVNLGSETDNQENEVDESETDEDVEKEEDVENKDDEEDSVDTEEGLEDDVETPEDVIIEGTEVYMDKVQEFEIEAEVGDAKLEDLEWTFNGKDLTEVKKWQMTTGEFDGDRLITFVNEPTIEDGVLRATVQFDYLFGESNLQQRNPDPKKNLRRTYRHYIGDYLLSVTNVKNGQTIEQTFTYRPYKNFHDLEEIYEKADEITEDAQKLEDRYVALEVYGQSVQGRDQKYAIVSDSKESVDKYLNETHPLMLTNPDELIELIKSGKYDYRIPVMFHNTHADENPALEIVLGLYEKLALQDTISFMTQDDDENERLVEFKVSDLLKRVILLFSFVENPDGAALNQRENLEGFDLNRDHGYQTLPETQNMVALLNKWDPLSFFDMHGFVNPTLIEPCTQPHDKNFEADLVYPHMMEEAKAIGHAIAQNTDYDFQIPAIDWEDGWDDAFSGYTGVYAVYHGIFGHTVEIPEMNQNSYEAGVIGGLGGLNFVRENIDDMMLAKLQVFSRGVNGENDLSVNEWFADEDGDGIRTENFFPDYYVIPMDDAQKNTNAAFEMIEYFERNGVIVNQLTEDAGIAHKGDLIINMSQAKRGYANHILASGADESKWDAMYAEVVTNFPAMRGFTSLAVFVEDDVDPYLDLLGKVTYTSAPRVEVGDYDYYKIKNNTVETIKAVNAAINNGGTVYLTEDGFIMDKATYDSIEKDYALPVSGIDKLTSVSGTALTAQNIYVPEAYPNYTGIVYPTQVLLVLQELGFNIVDNVDDADIIAMDSDNINEEYLGVRPTIVLGGWATSVVGQIIEGLEVATSDFYHEGLLIADVNKDNMLTSGYGEEDYFYTNEGTWIETLPEGFDTLLTIQNTNDAYVTGWWPGHEDVLGQIVAADGKFENLPLFLYAGTPTNKKHPQHLYNWLANAIFRGELATVTPPTPEQIVGDLKQQLEDLQAKLDQLKKDNEAAKEDIKALEERVAALQAEIDSLTDKCPAPGAGTTDETNGGETDKQDSVTDEEDGETETPGDDKKDEEKDEQENLPKTGSVFGSALLGLSTLMSGLGAAFVSKKRK